MDLKLVGRLITEVPETPPCYLPTNQSEKGHTLCSPPPEILPMKTVPKIPLGNSEVLSISCLRLLVWYLTINVALSFTTPWCQ